MHYEVYKDQRGEWRWTLYAANGNKIANSGEGYEHKQHCLHMIDQMKASSQAEVKIIGDTAIA